MILSVRQLSKSYGSVKALNSLSLEVEAGSIFGILGPNGSGKTTLLGILLDILRPDAGEFQWFDGSDAPAAARKRIGALLETPNFYPYLNAVENLRINAGIKGVSASAIDEAIERVGLSHRKTSRFHSYSLGMKQRLAIGNALLGSPEVLLLDEPTNGLDPQGIADIRTLIFDLRARGVTIIMASHLLDEVEKVCTHVAIIKQGQMLMTGSVQEIFQNDTTYELASADQDRLKEALAVMPGLQQVAVKQGMLSVTVSDDVDAAEINRHCAEQGVYLSHLAKTKQRLESRFMELTNGNG